MATERQIAASRRNARKSTGPRSSAAKKRTSRNAYRQCLSAGLPSSAAISKWLGAFARKIAGNSKNAIIIEHARAAVLAELDLARVRQIKLALIQRVSALGALDPSQGFGWSAEEIRYLKSILSGRAPPILPERVDPSATMPSQEPERTAEAPRRTLPELIRLNRYESRAVSRRHRAIREIVKIRSSRIADQDSDEVAERSSLVF